MGSTTYKAALTLLSITVAVTRAHGDGHMDMSMGDITSSPSSTPSLPSHRNFDLWDEPNYASHEGYGGLMMAHILFMILAWFFVLPVGESGSRKAART